MIPLAQSLSMNYVSTPIPKFLKLYGCQRICTVFLPMQNRYFYAPKLGIFTVDAPMQIPYLRNASDGSTHK
jgi:hypothetical protein